jgi:hypothetical protein
MTTIALRDGIMAADSRAYSGDRRPMGFKQKVFRLPDGSLFGATSSQPGLADMIRRAWIEFGQYDKNLPDEMAGQALIAKLDGSIYYYAGWKSFVGPLDGDYFAIGSGEDYAVGAMAMGASATKAIEVASIHDVFTDGPIRSLRLHDPSFKVSPVGTPDK